MPVKNLSAVDLNLLVAFDALMVERHVTRAAARVGLSQPAMSKALGRLRYLFDDPLFVQNGRAMEPTARALQSAAAVREALRRIHSALGQPDAFDPASSDRRFILTMHDVVERTLLPALLRDTLASAPNVRLDCVEADMSTAHARLAMGEIDLAIGGRGDTTGDLRFEPILRETFLVAAARNHPDLRAGLTLERYLELQHAVVPAEGCSEEIIDNVLASMGRTRRVALRLPHVLVLPQIVAATRLVAALPAQFARQIAPASGLALYELPLEVPPMEVFLAWHAHREGDPGHRWLRERVRDCVRGIFASAASDRPIVANQS